MTGSSLPSWSGRFRIGFANHERAVNLIVLGGLTLTALCCLCHLAESYSPDMNLAVGPDQDDWWGIFKAAEKGWPFVWDNEWSVRMPLVPILVFPVARALDVSMALASQMLTILLGSLVPGLTWLLGRQALGSPAALAASVWVIGQPTQIGASLMTTAYSYITPLYLLLLLGIAGTRRGRRGSRTLVFGASLLITALFMQGAFLVICTLGAATVAALLLPRKERPGIKLMTLRILPGLVAVGASIGLLAIFFPQLDSPLVDFPRYVHLDIIQSPGSDSMVPAMDILPHTSPGGGDMTGPPLEDGQMSYSLQDLELWFSIHPWLSLAGLALGLALLVARRSHSHGFARLLMVSCIPPVAIAFITNNILEHWFHWFPVLGLIMMVGLVWPLGLLPRIGHPAQWLVSISLVVWSAGDIQAKVTTAPEDPDLLHEMKGYYGEMRRNAKLCRQAFAPISQGGTLFTDSPQLFGFRGALRGPKAGRVVDISETMDIHHPGPPPLAPPMPLQLDLRRHERPWLLATDKQPRELAKTFSPVPNFSQGVLLDGGMEVGRHPFILYRYRMELGLEGRRGRGCGELPAGR